jgi:hypothetical protein
MRSARRFNRDHGIIIRRSEEYFQLGFRQCSPFAVLRKDNLFVSGRRTLIRKRTKGRWQLPAPLGRFAGFLLAARAIPHHQGASTTHQRQNDRGIFRRVFTAMLGAHLETARQNKKQKKER